MTPKTKRPKSGQLRSSDYQTLAEFRYLLRKFLAFSEQAARNAGVSPQQHQALLAIKAADGGAGVSVGELAERLSIRHHSAVGLADRLALENLLKRSPDTADRRRVMLVLTEKAEGLLADLTIAHRDELRRVAPTLKEILKRS